MEWSDIGVLGLLTLSYMVGEVAHFLIAVETRGAQRGARGGQGGTKGLATVVIVEISLSTESGKVNVAEIFSRVEIVCLEGLR